MKHKYQFVIIFLSFSILLNSCKKINSTSTNITIVQGIVINKLTNVPIINIPIEIIECEGWPVKCLTTLQTIFTDANGHYKTTINWEKGKSYSIAVGNNSKVAATPYPYYYPITKNIVNNINFSEFPLKYLKLQYRIQRHDKNWLQIALQGYDGNGFYAKDFYFGSNPINDFDSIYTFKIEAGRKYRAYVGLSNKTTPYTYENNEFVYKVFDIENVDTTSVNFIVL